MVLDQLLCIVAPPGEIPDATLRHAGSLLSNVFRRTGRIHFAAMTLLPPHPESDGPPSLLLELVIDEGLSGPELVGLLLQHGFEEMWFVYGMFCPAGERGAEVVRREWLQRFLQSHLHRADGGFVGARDRSVGQIHAEATLFQAARSALPRLRRPDLDRTALAGAVAAWAAKQAGLQWAAEPSARSFWRSRWMTLFRRVPLAIAALEVPLFRRWIPGPFLLSLLLVLATALAFIGLASNWLFLELLGSPPDVLSTLLFGPVAGAGEEATLVVAICAAIFMLFTSMAFVGVRSLTVAASLLLAFGAIVFLVTATAVMLSATHVFGWPETRDLAHAIGRLILHGGGVLLALALAWGVVGVCAVIALLVVPPFLGIGGVVIGGIVLLAFVLLEVHWAGSPILAGWVAASNGLHRQDLLERTIFGLPALTLALVTVFGVLTGLAWLALRAVQAAHPMDALSDASLDRVQPGLVALERAHQVHHSILACESELAARGAVCHMFSLTEIRDPVPRNTRMARFFLRVVGSLANTFFTEGRLGFAEGIRFAHWHLLDGRLLFCSNFDAPFSGYLDEFINGASQGINLIWRWTNLRKRKSARPGVDPSVDHERTFPPTRLWIFAGCKYEQRFKSYARDSMLPHVFRFEAYDYSAQDVERATRCRDALFGTRDPIRDDQLMRALES